MIAVNIYNLISIKFGTNSFAAYRILLKSVMKLNNIARKDGLSRNVGRRSINRSIYIGCYFGFAAL